MLEVGSALPSPSFRNYTLVKPQGGSPRDLGVRQSLPVSGSGVGEEEEEYAAAMQGCSSSGRLTHEGSVFQLLSQV